MSSEDIEFGRGRVVPSREMARMIVNRLGETGTPPEFGVGHFTVGVENYLNVLQEEYLRSFVSRGASSFKLVLGSYGGGKTHFLYLVRDAAWEANYAVSYVTLSPGECPFSKLELVYKSIMSGIMSPMEPENLLRYSERGIDPFIRSWFEHKKQELGDEEALRIYARGILGIESSSFRNAVRGAFLSLLEGREEDYEDILQWLNGEEPPREAGLKFRVSERLDKSTAFRLIRSLCQWVRQIDYAGLVLLFDEAERGLSIASSREKRMALDNLRQLIDECGNSRLPGVMILYAVPDDRALLEDRLESYEALRQRLSGVLEQVNPSGVRIDLERLQMKPQQFLKAVGARLAAIYQQAYPGFYFHPEVLEDVLANFASAAYSERYADISYRRIFVKSIIRAFHLLRERPGILIEEKAAKEIIREELSNLCTSIQKTAEEEEF